MAFTINLSGTAQVDDSIREEFDTEFRLAFEEMGSAAQFSSMKKDIGAKSISLPRYQHLAIDTTPLVETDDLDSEALIDDAVIVTPKEFGKVVTKTSLASLQTGGMVDRAAARVVGVNAGRTTNKLAIEAMDASTNVIYSDGVSRATIVAADIMTPTLMGQVFNKLSRKSVPTIAGGSYVMLAHDDVIHDLRESSGANTWIDAHKYALPEALLKNEIGMYKGFRVVRDNLSTIYADGGALNVDVYASYFIGFNAFGDGQSQAIEMRATGPFDKLARFVNLGWYGVLEYKIIDNDALWIVESASSVGDNA